MRIVTWLLALAWLGSWLEGCGGDEEAARPQAAAGAGGEEPEHRRGSGGEQDRAGAGGRESAGGTESAGSGVNVGGADFGSAGDVSISGGAVDGGGSASCAESEPVTLSHGAGRASEPSAVWTGDGYAVVWSDDRDGNSELYFARLDALGQQVGPELRLTDDLAESSEPSLVWNGADLGLSWTDSRDGNTEIYFTVLDRTGRRRASQLANLRVTKDANRSELSRLIWAGDGYALSWSDDREGDFDVYFTTLSRAGTKTSSDVPVGRGAASDLALTSTGFALVWQSARDATGAQIYFALLNQDGSPWDQELRLSDPNETGSDPRIAFDGAALGVAWRSGSGGGGLRWRRLDADGKPLGEVEPLTSGDVGAPSLLQQPAGGFGMAFVDASSAERQVAFLEVDDAGQLEGPPRAVTDAGVPSAPSLIMMDPGYAAAWVDGAGESQSSVRFRLFCSD
jgi:hypothetical protein